VEVDVAQIGSAFKHWSTKIVKAAQLMEHVPKKIAIPEMKAGMIDINVVNNTIFFLVF